MRALAATVVATAVTAAAVLTAVLPAVAAAGSDSSIRCAHGIVSLGDATVDLLGKCGAPTLREGGVEQTSLVYAGGGAVRAITVGVERWTYDFGPQRFTVVVTLIAGKVTAVDNGGYGYASGGDPAAVPLRRARCEPSALRVGDRKLDLLARCGEPSLAERRDDLLQLVADPAMSGVVLTRTVVVPVEVWTYDFGPQTFVRFVTLENGVVTRVDTGSHGYAR